jgi:hypothetical protein
MCVIDWESVPAWVQAVGSVGAILIAVYVSNKQSKAARALISEERGRQAKIAAALLSGRFHDAEMEAREVLEQVEGLITTLGNAESVTFGSGANTFGMFHLTSVESLSAQRGLLMLFPTDNAEVAGRAIDSLDNFNRRTLRFMRHADEFKLDTKSAGNFLRRLQKELRELAKTASEAALVLAEP